MKYLLRTLLLFALLSFLSPAISFLFDGFAFAATRQQQQNITVTSNEGSAMKSLRALLDAEVKFQSTTGKGEFGDLKDLHDAGLIDNDLARGVKDGYRLTILIKISTMTTHPAIDLVARPSEYGKDGRRSFYLTETGVMMTSEEKDAPLTSMRPFAIGGGATKAAEQKSEATITDDPTAEAIAGEVSTNEASVMATLLIIHSAEAKYMAKAGAGAYGTLEELEKAGLIEKAQTAATQQGYLLEVKIGAAKPALPATFSISAVPQTYGMSGRNSFFVDQTGVVRGADKEGGPADATDPPLK